MSTRRVVHSCGHLGDSVVSTDEPKHIIQIANLAAVVFRQDRAMCRRLCESRLAFPYGNAPTHAMSLHNHGSNLVDSASSHTLVSKIKPCTSENKEFSLNLRMAHYISYSLFDSPLLLG